MASVIWSGIVGVYFAGFVQDLLRQFDRLFEFQKHDKFAVFLE